MKKRIKKYQEPGSYEIVISFDQAEMECEWVGIVDARLPGDYMIKVTAHHSAVNCRGRVVVKAVVGVGAKVEIRGIIKIEKEGQGTDDFLELRALTLGPSARAIVVPELEIEANNVRASHAASVGGIEEEQLRYLGSRGLTRSYAIEQVIEGWLGV